MALQGQGSDEGEDMQERLCKPGDFGGSRVTGFFVRLAERFFPNPFLFAVVLTLIAAMLATIFVTANPITLMDDWHNGSWGIPTFALQMALIVLTGYTVAQSKPVSGFLDRLASKPNTQGQALAPTIVAASLASLINWGFGLDIAAIMARFIGKRMENIGYAVASSASECSRRRSTSQSTERSP